MITSLNRNPSARIIKVDQSYLKLQQNVKVPMLAYISAAAQLSGILVLSLKVATTILQEGDVDKLWKYLVPLIFVGMFCLDQQLHFLNQAIKLYDQMEIIPIYQTFVLFFWTLVGLVVFEEYRFYTVEEILGLAATAGICLLGVKSLTAKRQKITETEESELSSSGHINLA